MANEMGALGELICRINPYTNRAKDSATGMKKTGAMQIQPPHVNGSAAKAGRGTTPKAPTIDEILRNIPVEVVRNYGEKWSFKGQTLDVNTAVRIPYSFEVTTDSGETYWQTETLLIGFAGSEGPG